MINRSQIMSHAWWLARNWADRWNVGSREYAKGMARGKDGYTARERFAECLRMSWSLYLNPQPVYDGPDPMDEDFIEDEPSQEKGQFLAEEAEVGLFGGQISDKPPAQEGADAPVRLLG